MIFLSVLTLTPPPCGSQCCYGNVTLGVLEAYTCWIPFVLAI